jgi:hypothetical protein
MFSALGSANLKCIDLSTPTEHALTRELYFAASGSGLWISSVTGYAERADDIDGIDNVMIGTFDCRARVKHCQKSVGVSIQTMRQYIIICFDVTPTTIAHGRGRPSLKYLQTTDNHMAARYWSGSKRS